MNPFSSLINGLKSLFQKPRVDRELEEELDAYLEASAAHKERAGLTAQQARRLARIEVGSRNSVKHRVWQSRWESIPDNLLHDLRFAVRQLARTPGFSIVALLSLALGIGANTAIFTLINAVLLRPLPVAQPQQLVLFGQGSWVGSIDSLPNRQWDLFSASFYRTFASKSTAFSGVTAVSSIQMGSRLALNGGVPEPVHIDLVSGSYFNVLGVPPALGRTLAESDDRGAGSGPVAIASYAWFQRHFAGDPSAIGRTLTMQGHDYTLVGVAKPGFTGLMPGSPADFWIPLSMEKEISPGWNGLDDKWFQSLYLIARLKPGVTREQAQSSSNLLFQQILRSDYLTASPSPKDLDDVSHARIELTSAARGIPRLSLKFSQPLEILMAIVGLVLLIACANIANMLLARGVARTREIAVRQALGATRKRIVVQLLTESLLLSFAGSALGLVLAWRATRLLLLMVSGSAVPIPLDLTPDLRVLGFALAVTCLTALLFGVAPALRTTRLQLVPALKDGRTSSSASTRSGLARGLIIGQVALSILLVTVSGLFLRSLVNLTRVDLGFDPRNVLVFTLDEYSANLPLDSRMVQMQQQIEQRVQALPGVQSASFSMFTFNQGEWSDPLLVQGVPRTPENSHDVLYNVIGTQYFSTFGIPLVAGRNFTAEDQATSPQVAIVNETFARRFFPAGSPSAIASTSATTPRNPTRPRSSASPAMPTTSVSGKSHRWPPTSPGASACSTSATSPCASAAPHRTSFQPCAAPSLPSTPT